MSGQASSIIDRFEVVCRQRAEEPAVLAPGMAWSYGDLRARSIQFTAALVERRGLASEPVALLFRHGAEMIAAIMGTLGAGKLYVPLIPDWPLDRLRDIVAESGCATVLAEPDCAALAQRLGCATVIDNYGGEHTTRSEFLKRPADAVTYVLYTSGSTGRPKGVFQTDENVLHHTDVYAASVGLHPGDRMTLFPAYSFDASVMDIFGTLMSGATLCVWDVRRHGLLGLRDWLTRNRITVWHSTPSLLRVAFPTFAEPADLSWIVLGGEVATGRDVGLAVSFGGPRCRVLNGLGPTECTVALQYVADLASDCAAPSLPVGRAVDGVEVSLNDPDGRPSPTSGEIVIRSRYLALGYWRRPDLTSQKFRQCPSDPAMRIYCSGDLARRRADGCLEAAGRIDDQVKINGQRINLLDVQAAVSQHPNVDMAAVRVKVSERTGRHEIVAYIVFSDASSGDSGALRLFLSTRLPTHMVPSRFVSLEALPLLHNGKVDLAALPSEGGADNRRPHRAPTTPLEKTIAQLWAEVLCQGGLGLDDDFFSVGGDSLQGTLVLSRVRSLLRVDIGLRDLFVNPTIGGLAASIALAARKNETPDRREAR